MGSLPCTSRTALLVLLLAGTAVSDDPFAVSTCRDELARQAFLLGDVSKARAELAVHREGPEAARKCAVKAWQQGVGDLVRSGTLDGVVAASESRVYAGFGNRPCVASVETGSWLDIPRLQEVLICVDTGKHVFRLEQDGFLRAFDMATVLWPAGFFLTLWVSRHCGMLQGHILELGAGIGAPSIAASLCGNNVVLATDKDMYGLVNVVTNARINGANVAARTFNWENDAEVDVTSREGPFDVILGAGLAPHRWTERMWAILSKLLRPKIGRVVLCHGTGDIDLKSGSVGGGTFLVEEVVAGDDYGLQTRWGTESEFELAILRHATSDEL